MLQKAEKCLKRQENASKGRKMLENAGNALEGRKMLDKAGKYCVITIDNQVSALEEENRGLREYTENLRRFFI